MEAPEQIVPGGRKKGRTKKSATPSSPRPHVRTQQSARSSTYKITAYPFRTTIEHLAALGQQRDRERESELQRQAMHIGSLFLAIAGEPGSDGRYGLFSVEQLARQIRPYVVAAADWLQQQGYPLQSMHAPAVDASFASAFMELLQRGTVPQGAGLNVLATARPEVDLSAVSDVYLPDALEGALGLDDVEGFS